MVYEHRHNQVPKDKSRKTSLYCGVNTRYVLEIGTIWGLCRAKSSTSDKKFNARSRQYPAKFRLYPIRTECFQRALKSGISSGEITNN